MNHASLTAKYRPQAFAEVTGQNTIKTILSRAAAKDKVAPAYLLSGTRGIGKTTIARIFAKALNCENAPAPEPCNVCGPCRRITQGSHVDVIEIDGASNRGIDDARRLREAIAYAPMEGRYKVFIIDEAHMLTKDAFNALLKTLEEPPPRVVFILATTEPHKFPITIVSRCQHFTFQAQAEAELTAHLEQVLAKEGVIYEETAVRLLARRAQGSVRDAMSLMAQTLALGGDTLNEAATRDVLGLAGMEAFEKLLQGVLAEDCMAVSVLCRELLERGIDIGFFLRELAALWRNLFMLRQTGNAAAEFLDFPEAERKRLADLAPRFELSFIHAAWHMVLESQRQILTSLEPASALELLLLNLTLLSRLVPLEALGGSGHAGMNTSMAPPASPSSSGASAATKSGASAANSVVVTKEATTAQHSDYAGNNATISKNPPEGQYKNETSLKQEMSAHPAIKELIQTFDGFLLRCMPLRGESK
jgi:DNA polymerase-3 subunit gamma/tau